ncbi:MAG: hypothetical protein WC208_08505 [Gallionella sp.]|jgi:hypothetical protein
MDKKTVRKEVIDLQAKYRKFEESLAAMNKKRNEAQTAEELSNFEMLKWRFIKSVVEPLERAWAKLTPQEKQTFAKENPNGTKLPGMR